MDDQAKRAKHAENMTIQKESVHTDFTRVDTQSSYQIKDVKQNVFVYNMSHRSIPPLAVNPEFPALRILRSFGSSEAATEYAHRVSEKFPECSIMLAPSASWVLGASSFEDLGTSKEQDKVNTLIDAHLRKNSEMKQEFDDRVKRQREAFKKGENPEPKGGHSNPKAPKKKTSIRKQARASKFENENFTCVHNEFDISLENKDQQFSVIALVRPVENDGHGDFEYAFQFLQSFETSEKADEFIRNTAGPVYKNFDLFVFRTYMWIDVRNDQGVKSVYRDEKLQRIVDRHQAQQSEAESYKEKCKEQDIQPRVIEIGKDGINTIEPQSFEPESEPEPEPESEPAPEPEPEPEPLQSRPLRRSQRIAKGSVFK